MSNFLKAITVKTEVLKLETINQEVEIKQLTMNESDDIERLRQKVIKGEADNKDLIIQSCRFAMINPTCPTDEELKDISRAGFEVLTEIYMSIPMIGMTEEQKEDYKKRVFESISNQVKKMVSKAETEKKQEKKKSSSLN